MTPRTSRAIPRFNGFRPKPLNQFDTFVVENWLGNIEAAQQAFFDRVRAAAIEKGADPGPLLSSAAHAIANYLDRKLSPISIPVEMNAFMSTNHLK